jgi:TolB-like protein/Flp pilus assembly protein TadD
MDWTMPRTVRFDCFEVDLAAGQLYKRGIRISLREKSFRVLELLLEHPGQVVSREELHRRLWQEEVFVDFDNNLNAAIARLRKALDDSKDHPHYIETLPKRGYRFLADVSEPVLAPRAAQPRRPRLVVLPFLNLTGDPAQEYLSDALTEDVITALASLAPGHLAVIARTTSMHYKTSRKDVARIGREVGVDYVVEGAFRRTAEQVSVNAQLVQTSDEAHLFARRYEAELRDIFRMQGSIAYDIATNIPAMADKICGAETAKRPTENVAAYDEYIRGRYEMWKWTPEGIGKAKQHFEAALALDPNFALACDALANLYGYLGLWGFLPPDEAEPFRWFYGLRAFELDPALAEPRTHVAYHPEKCRYEDAYSYNWAETERQMARARDLNPNSPLVRVRHSTVLVVLGRAAEAVAELECALELDPLSLEVRFWLVVALFFSRQYEQAFVQAKKLVGLEPEHHVAFMALGHVYLGMRRFDESITAFRHAAELSQGFPLMLGWLGLALGLGGHASDARLALERLRAIASKRFVLPTSFAWIHLGLGECDEAFAWMEQAASHNDEWIHPLKVYPFLDPLRSDPRLHALMRKLNLE